MAHKRQRVAAVLAALLFLFSSLAASIAVIWLLVSQKTSTSTTTPTNTSSESTQSPLIGTKLQNFTPVASVPALQIIDTKVGTGAVATANSTVVVDYVGALAKDGTVFDASTAGSPATLALNQVVPGFQQGVTGMKVGGVRRVLIPAALGYGAQSPSENIPANADLVFDITLDKVQ